MSATASAVGRPPVRTPYDSPPALRTGPRAWMRAAIGRVLSVSAGLLLIVFIVGPLVWMGISAFSKRWKAPSLLPQSWTLQWWRTVFSGNQLSHAFFLSLTFAVLATATSGLICLPAAYALGRARFPGRRVILLGIFATNAFPKMGLFTSIATLFYALHLMTTVAGVVIIQLLGTVVTMIWIPAAAFAAVPQSLIDAARDVGASPGRVFRSVTLRLARPGILVAVILSFLSCFDESQGTYLVGAPNYITLPTQMYSLVENYPQQAAAVFAIVLTIPSVLLLLAVRRHVMGGQLAEGFAIT